MAEPLSENVSVRVGFVGLGKMGWPMARNLVQAGFALTVRDADPQRQAGFAAEYGCDVAESPAAFGNTPFVVTMLPDDKVVREAVLGWEGGIAAALPASAVIVDMSSSNPRGTRALGEELARLGVALVDAPVSGGVPRAETGTLAIMIGADDEAAIERVEPVLHALGDRLFRTGPLGSGHAMKSLNNYVAAAAYTAATEALAVGQQYGLEPATMVEVLNASTGRSFSTEHVLAEHVLPGRYATGFALGLMAKDVGIAADLVEAGGIDAPVCKLVSARWAQAAAALGFAADHSEAHKEWWSSEFADRATEEAPAIG
jgi:3-hydroxyisobutyrate dehydrogenase